jgi:transposase-like protein
VELSLPALANRIPTEADAYTLLEEMRWHGKPVCPHCGSIDKHYFLKPRNGISRETSCGNQTQRRLWKCSACRMQFSVLTGTVMHGTKIPVRTWLFVAFEFASSKNGVAAREIERKYRLHGNSAWTLCHRLREAMRLGPYSALFVGTVIADETYVGGEVSNNHRQGDTAKRARGRKPGGPAQKTPVFSIVHQQTGEVRSWVLADVNSRSVGELLRTWTFRARFSSRTAPASTAQLARASWDTRPSTIATGSTSTRTVRARTLRRDTSASSKGRSTARITMSVAPT